MTATAQNVKDRKAFNAIMRSRVILVVSQPFFGALALHLDLQEDTNGELCQTMAVDGVHMYYYPKFVNSLSEQELVGVIAHEVMHCALQHMSRRCHRNHVIWNMAGDYVINADLLRAGFTLPAMRLHDPKFSNMSTEEVYEKLKQEAERQLQQPGNSKRGKGGNAIAMPDTDLKVPDPGGCGGVMDAGNGPADKVGADSVARDWDANVRMAVNVAKRAHAGNVPGYLERLVRVLEEPKVSWRDVTRQFIDTSMTKDYSWSYPNRRYAAQGLYLPGFVSDALHHLVMAIDVSGSITGAMVQAMVSEGAGALNGGVADMLTILYADTKVRKVDQWYPGDMVEASTVGGGGTCFDDSFRWIKDNASDASCVVYLTDMLTSSFGQDPGIPVLWGCYLPAAMLATINPPFGMKIEVDPAP